MAESQLMEKAENGGPKLLIIRPGVLYSADGARLTRRSVQLKDSRMLIGFGSGRNHIPFTRVDVLAKKICDILENDHFPEGIYNMTGTPDESSKEFIYNRMKRLGVICRFIRLPVLPFN